VPYFDIVLPFFCMEYPCKYCATYPEIWQNSCNRRRSCQFYVKSFFSGFIVTFDIINVAIHRVHRLLRKIRLAEASTYVCV
jgi:hypothetical protein